MKKKRVPPFQGMTSVGWQNLALAAIFTYYIILLAFSLINNNMCGNLAGDYCAYWSGGRIINQGGIADIYDLDLLTQFQKEIYPQANSSSILFQPVEVPYLPIFVLPFQFLSLLNLPSSFLVWTLINLIGFILYLRFFAKEVTGNDMPFRLVLMIILSLPVFVNLLEGQLNIWLGICAGEFIRAFLSDKPYRAGLWLGGWLLKPQLLILIIPFLLIQRSFKVLTGFIVSAIAALVISFGLINADGFLRLKNILLESAEGGVTSHPQAMMNWRMLGWHIASFTSSTIGWTIIILGSALTVCVTLFIFRRRLSLDSTQDAIALLGIFAATGVVTWHAHLHMSIILIPVMVYLIIKNSFNEKLFLGWVFMPILVQFISYIIIAAYINLEILPTSIDQVSDLARGLPGFILNLLFLGWAILQYTRTKKETPEGVWIVNENDLT